jgi:very-short-patch-repair endonuclease
MKRPGVVKQSRVSSAKAEAARTLRRIATLEERMLWQRLRSGRLSGLHFRRQQVIQGFIVDFYCHEVGLIVEVDGPGHQRDTEYDNERDEVMRGLGLRVIRFRNEEVGQDVNEVLRQIERECRQG